MRFWAEMHLDAFRGKLSILYKKPIIEKTKPINIVQYFRKNVNVEV